MARELYYAAPLINQKVNTPVLQLDAQQLYRLFKRYKPNLHMYDCSYYLVSLSSSRSAYQLGK
jgi:hypothetical protein